MLEKLKEYYNNKIQKNRDFNQYDLLKNIAFFTMLVDHIGYYFLPKFAILRLIGRISMFLFSILHGITYKKNNKILLLYGIGTQFIINIVERSIFPLNILFTFFISGIFMDTIKYIYDKLVLIFILIIIFFIPLAITTNIFVEYGLSVLLLMFCGQLFKKENIQIKDKITIGTIFISYGLYQKINFNFNNIYTIFLLFLFAIIYYYLLKEFSFKKINYNNKILLIISRFSIELYSLHLLIFTILYRIIW